MNELVNYEDPDQELEQATEPPVKWEMKKLKPKHRQICALLAQGFKNIEIAAMVGVTKEYVCMLQQQPLMKQEIARISEVAGVRLEAMFEKSVDIIGDVMSNGNNTEKLKAVRLHGEITKRIGRPDPYAIGQSGPDDRLTELANRLEHLLDTKKPGLYDEKGNPLFEEAEVIRTIPVGGGTSSAP